MTTEMESAGLDDLRADLESVLSQYFELIREANRGGYVVFYGTKINEKGEVVLGDIHILHESRR